MDLVGGSRRVAHVANMVYFVAGVLRVVAEGQEVGWVLDVGDVGAVW